MISKVITCHCLSWAFRVIDFFPKMPLKLGRPRLAHQPLVLQAAVHVHMTVARGQTIEAAHLNAFATALARGKEAWGPWLRPPPTTRWLTRLTRLQRTRPHINQPRTVKAAVPRRLNNLTIPRLCVHDDSKGGHGWRCAYTAGAWGSINAMLIAWGPSGPLCKPTVLRTRFYAVLFQ